MREDGFKDARRVPGGQSRMEVSLKGARCPASRLYLLANRDIAYPPIGGVHIHRAS